MTKLPGITRVPLPVTDKDGNAACAWCGEAVSRRTNAHYFKKHSVQAAPEGAPYSFVVVE